MNSVHNANITSPFAFLSRMTRRFQQLLTLLNISLVLKLDAPGNGETVQAINNEIGNTLPKNTATNSCIENSLTFIKYLK